MNMNWVARRFPVSWKYRLKGKTFLSHSSTFIIKTTAISFLLLPILILVLVMPACCADQNNGGIKVYCNGNFQGSTAYIDPASGVSMVPLALIQSLPGLRLDVRDNQAWFTLNGRHLSSTIGSNTYTMDGQSKTWRCGLQPWQYGIAVPGRDLFEALGASIRWDAKERAIYITTPVPTPTVPKNLSETSWPLHLAFVQDEQLWLLDASEPEAQPLLVPSCNIEQIIGWSHDGKWLAYLQRSGDDKFSEKKNLWIVSSDGLQPQCLDTLPVAYNTPLWSPTENTIAYEVLLEDQADSNNMSLRVAGQENGKWQYQELLKSDDRRLGSGLAWFPDGQSLLISWTHDEKNRPELDRIDLQGKISSLFVLPAALAGDFEDGMYIRDISGLKLSPDGRFVACFLGMNSASINSDSMSLYIIDLQSRVSSFEVGCALGYPEWLAWSPDSRKLAAILGYDRVASSNKHLQLVQVDENGYKSQDLGVTGQVDSRPIWDIDGNTLYFTRGQASEAWLEEGRHQEVQVLGQQLLCRQNDRNQSISQPGEMQADYPLSLSPNGQYLAMQRLTYADLGALYIMNLNDGQMIQLMDNVQANPGYYGNYYPDMVSIYWIKNEVQ